MVSPPIGSHVPAPSELEQPGVLPSMELNNAACIGSCTNSAFHVRRKSCCR